jgi:hypothetical protein
MRNSGGTTARGEGAEDDHHGEQQSDPEDAVAIEDRLDHVADCGELDERAGDRHGDVALEVRALPERDGAGDRHQRERRGDVPEAEVDRVHRPLAAGAEASRSAPRSRTRIRSVSRRACCGS